MCWNIYMQGDLKVRKKICPIFQKVAQKVSQVAKIYTTKLNLEAQNISIKPLLKP